MKVLIACEFSGTVRRAFRERGHDAWSCDILPAEDNSPYHYQQDVSELLGEGWDLMIAHPPCTHLAVSGAAHFAKKRADGRQGAALDFVRLLLAAPIEKIALENPVSIISSQIRKPSQIVNPFQFGESISKKTCLWLKGLTPLVPTQVVQGSVYHTAASGRRYPDWCWKTGGGSGHKRSRFFEGIAQAMAEQWG
jgi:site-specific DNA-cytosine methylase